MISYIKAEQGLQHSVIYTTNDGRYFRYSKGKRTWRNNNPGNLVSGDISKKHNQIGVAGGFAVFPNYDTGHSALLDCLKSTFGDKSIDQMIKSFAPLEENPNLLVYKKDLHKQTGVVDSTKIKNFTPQQFENLWKTIEKWEGWKEGIIVEVYKVSCTRKNKKNTIAKYCIDTIGWIENNECISLAKQGKIDAAICKSHSGNSYLRARAHSSLQKNFGHLLEKA